MVSRTRKMRYLVTRKPREVDEKTPYSLISLQGLVEYFKDHKSNSKYSKEILEVFNSLKYYENHR